MDAKWKKAKAKAESTYFDETNWIDEQDDLIEMAFWVTREERQIHNMSDSLTSSKEEQLKKDKGNEHQEHNLWSFIKGKKKQNHVPSTADIKGKKLPVASNHNDCEFKGKKGKFFKLDGCGSIAQGT